MRDAVALVRRIEMQIEAEPAPVVIGFRRDGSASIYFGGDPAYHFNTRHELRRGYDNGQLLKAERGHLIALTRCRTERETQLVRRDVTDRETTEYLSNLEVRLAALRESLDGDCPNILHKFPPTKTYSPTFAAGWPPSLTLFPSPPHPASVSSLAWRYSPAFSRHRLTPAAIR